MTTPEQEENKLGLFSVILLGINSIIGSGIFLLPGQVMALADLWSILIYGFVALLVLAIAWCFAQCATLFNRSGGAYVYAKEAFGDFIGFEIGLMRWFVGMIAWASLAVGFITALGVMCPLVLEQPIKTVAIISLIGGLGCLNLLGINIIQRLNNLVTVAKIIPLVFFVCIGIFFMEPTHFSSGISFDELESGSLGAAALVIFYAFGGFEALTVAAQEMKNPTKNVPLAVMAVVTACSLLYFLIQIIAIGTLGASLAESSTPIADAAGLFFGRSLQWLILVAMLISIGGVNIVCSFIVPRSGVVLAEDRMIPSIIANKNKNGAPYFAIFLTVIATILVALSGNFTQLITISVVSRFAQYISTCLAVFVFRDRLAVFKHRGPFYVLRLMIPLAALSGIFWLFFHASPSQIYWGLGGLAVGVPLYFIQKYQGAKAKDWQTDI